MQERGTAGVAIHMSATVRRHQLISSVVMTIEYSVIML